VLAPFRAAVPLCPTDLPESGDPARWSALRRLRQDPVLDPSPWLLALEAGELAPAPDLLTVLAPHLAPADQLRLLRWWRQQPAPAPELPALVVRQRDPALAAWLRSQLSGDPLALAGGGQAEVAAALLPLLGHQRQPEAWPLLRRWLEAPLPQRLRRAALEGIALGLPVWPPAQRAAVLTQLAADLDPRLAATAVDLLARLPGCRRQLVPLRRGRLDAAVAGRLQRRLAATPGQPLLLVVHGRSGGVLPDELVALAAELEGRRQAPVRLQALTAAAPPPRDCLLQSGVPLTLVPLLLLPGGHVRQDVPAIAAQWRRQGAAVQRWPFLGAWPRWQQGLRRELQTLAAGPGQGASPPPLLLHHPLASPLAGRYLAVLEQVCAARAVPTPYSADCPQELPLTSDAPALPLALAANRLTDRFGAWVGPPLLERPALRALLLELLEALP
jgi:hypothetical protein